MAGIKEKYDVAIIGSGLGGLQCAYILAKEGYKVAVFEKNHQIGGSLQVFSRKKCVFDTGVHYLGGLDEGKNLRAYFDYFGLTDALKLVRLNDECFDKIEFEDSQLQVPLAQGYDTYIRKLVELFPEEENAIKSYCDLIQSFCSKFKLYNLEVSDLAGYMDDPVLLQSTAHEVVAKLTSNKALIAALFGNNMLYAGRKNKTPFFVHALITNSYIEGSYRIFDGGSQIAIELSRAIRKMGGELFRRTEITGAKVTDGKIVHLTTKNNEEIVADAFISNLHPTVTTDIVGHENFRKSYLSRIGNIDNSVSSFCSHFVLEPNSFDYIDHNIYLHKKTDQVWMGDQDEEEWPGTIMISTPGNSKNPTYAAGITVMAFMESSVFEKWNATFNTVTDPSDRGDAYTAFKEHYQQIMLARLESRFPGISKKIVHGESSTPLSFRDYLNTPNGTAYGMEKDVNMPINAFINPKTKVKNLYLTGQNVVMHGILGVTIGSFLTCMYFVDAEKLIADVRKASSQHT